ncbi:hypothetical protein D3C79_1034880 [compost metagenome]
MSLLLRCTRSETENDILIFSFKANAMPAPIWKLSPMRTLPGVSTAGLELMSSKDSSMLYV